MIVKYYRKYAAAFDRHANNPSEIFLGDSIKEVASKSKSISGKFRPEIVQDVALIEFSNLKEICNLAGIEMEQMEKLKGEAK